MPAVVLTSIRQRLNFKDCRSPLDTRQLLSSFVVVALLQLVDAGHAAGIGLGPGGYCVKYWWRQVLVVLKIGVKY